MADTPAETYAKNERILEAQKRKLASDDEEPYLAAAEKLTRFLQGTRAYYPMVRDTILDILEAARDSLTRLSGSPFPFQCNLPCPPHLESRRLAYSKLVNTVVTHSAFFAGDLLKKNKLMELGVSAKLTLEEEQRMNSSLTSQGQNSPAQNTASASVLYRATSTPFSSHPPSPLSNLHPNLSTTSPTPGKMLQASSSSMADPILAFAAPKTAPAVPASSASTSSKPTVIGPSEVVNSSATPIPVGVPSVGLGVKPKPKHRPKLKAGANLLSVDSKLAQAEIVSFTARLRKGSDDVGVPISPFEGKKEAVTALIPDSSTTSPPTQHELKSKAVAETPNRRPPFQPPINDDVIMGDSAIDLPTTLPTREEPLQLPVSSELVKSKGAIPTPPVMEAAHVNGAPDSGPKFTSATDDRATDMTALSSHSAAPSTVVDAGGVPSGSNSGTASTAGPFEVNLAPKQKPRKRKEKKIIPLGRNGYKKKRVMKSRTNLDDKGCMITEDYSSYESVDDDEGMAEREKETAKSKPKAKKKSKVTSKKTVATDLEAETHPQNQGQRQNSTTTGTSMTAPPAPTTPSETQQIFQLQSPCVGEGNDMSSISAPGGTHADIYLQPRQITEQPELTMEESTKKYLVTALAPQQNHPEKPSPPLADGPSISKPWLTATAPSQTSKSIFRPSTAVAVSINPGVGIGHSVVMEFELSSGQETLLSLWKTRMMHLEETSNSICLSLTCYTLDDVVDSGVDFENDEVEGIMTKLLSLKPSWPTHSLLSAYIGSSRVFLAPPLQLTEENFVDLTSYVNGKNMTIRLEHSADMTNYVYALFAHPPTPSQLQALADRHAKDQAWSRYLKHISRPFTKEEICGR